MKVIGEFKIIGISPCFFLNKILLMDLEAKLLLECLYGILYMIFRLKLIFVLFGYGVNDDDLSLTNSIVEYFFILFLFPFI